MRKHFLLLFLMALLPLAGWAQQTVDISLAKFTIGQVSYNYTAATPVVATQADPQNNNKMVPTVIPAGATDPLIWGTDYTLVYYDANQTPIEEANVATQVKNVGKYYVAAKGTGNYSGTTAMVEFQILPAELKIIISAVIEKQYGNETKPNVTFKWNSSTSAENNVTFSGWLTGDDTEANKNTIVNSLAFAWTDAEKTANANGAYTGSNETWEYYNSATSGYELNFSATSFSNSYTYKFVHEGLRVTPVPLSVAVDTKFTFAADYTKVAQDGKSGGYLYSGTAQVPNYTITYKDPQNNIKTLIEKKGTATTGDYTVSYEWCATSNGDFYADNSGNTSAGFYKPTIQAVQNGNYSGYVPFPAKFDGNTNYYQIRKKDLKINIKDQNKVYNGTPFTSDDVVYNPLGLVPADAVNAITDLYANENTPAFSYTPSIPFAKDAKTYKATPSVDTDKLADPIKNNYKVVAGTAGFLTISKRPVTVTAVNLEREMEEEDPDLAALDLAGANYADYANYVTIQTTGENVGLASDAEAEKKDVLKAVSLALDYEYAGATTYTGAVKVTIDNTKSTNYIVTGSGADFHVKGYTVNISAIDNNKIYGQSVDDLDYATSGLIGNFGEGTDIKYIIKKNNGTALDESDYINGRLKANTYQIVLDTENSVVNLPADYDGFDIDPTPATLTIAQKTIYAIPAPVTLSVGNTIDDLNTLGKDAVRFLDSNVQNATTHAYTGSDAIEEGDVISYMLTFSDGGVTLDTDNKTIIGFSSTAANNTIKVKEVLPTGTLTPAVPEAELPYYVENNANANYTIIVTTTALVTNGQGVLVLDRTDAELLTKLAASDGKTYTVKFANNRTLSAQKWAMMVLPFDTDVATVSAAMKARKSTWTSANPAYETGYAIVNTLKSNTTSSNIQFELAFGELPANKPFLVKTSKQVNLNDVVFEGVEIDDPAAEEVPGDTYGGVVFMGLYTNKADLSNTERTIKANIWYTNHTNIGLQAFEAYLAGCGQAARVFIEDIDDNGTTAIKELNAETGKAYNVDGWYTVNGIKLESMPTEKGVYINNGKKVVIK